MLVELGSAILWCQDRRRFGSLAIAAIRRASSLVSSFAADRRPGSINPIF